MPKTPKRKKIISRSSTIQSSPSQTLLQANLNKPQTDGKPYDPKKYFVSDLKWSAISAGIVAIVLIIAYIVIH